MPFPSSEITTTAPVKYAYADALHVDSLFRSVANYSLSGEECIPNVMMNAMEKSIILSGMPASKTEPDIDYSDLMIGEWYPRYDEEARAEAERIVTDHLTGTVLPSRTIYERAWTAISGNPLPDNYIIHFNELLSGLQVEGNDPYRLYFARMTKGPQGMAIIGKFDENGNAILPSGGINFIRRAKGVHVGMYYGTTTDTEQHIYSNGYNRYDAYFFDDMPDVTYSWTGIAPSAELIFTVNLTSPWNVVSRYRDNQGQYVPVKRYGNLNSNGNFGYYNNQYRHNDVDFASAFLSADFLDNFLGGGFSWVVWDDDAQIGIQSSYFDNGQDHFLECAWGNNPFFLMEKYNSDWLIMISDRSSGIRTIIPNEEALAKSIYSGSHQWDEVRLTLNTYATGTCRGYAMFRDGEFLSGAWNYYRSSTRISGLIT